MKSEGKRYLLHVFASFTVNYNGSAIYLIKLEIANLVI